MTPVLRLKGQTRENITIQCSRLFRALGFPSSLHFCGFPFAVLSAFPPLKCTVTAKLELRPAASLVVLPRATRNAETSRPGSVRVLRLLLLSPSAAEFVARVSAVTQCGPFRNSRRDLGVPAAEAQPVGFPARLLSPSAPRSWGTLAAVPLLVPVSGEARPQIPCDGETRGQPPTPARSGLDQTPLGGRWARRTGTLALLVA